jgi:phage terminase large subunit
MKAKLFNKTSVVYEANLNATDDVVVNQGGTSSGKTYSILQCLITLSCENETQIITVVGQDIPNLKAGALRDMETIISESDALKTLIVSYNRTDRVFTFWNKSVMEFKSYENFQDAKSGKRDYLFINEAQGINKTVFDELHLRTKKRTFIDYNPNEEFWVHEFLIGKPNVALIISDHRHNPFVPDKIREKIEGLKDVDIQLWRVYARGMTGKLIDTIFPNINYVGAIHQDAKFIAYGLDWGFTNDPTALLEVYLQDGELWVNELLYETRLTNQDVCARMDEMNISKHRDIIADSSEPKSIQEVGNMGYNIYGAQKGADSVKASIDILKRYKINVTTRSHNLRKELKSYRWKQDSNGGSMNIPVDFKNHLIDALRYVALNKLSISDSGRYNLIL